MPLPETTLAKWSIRERMSHVGVLSRPPICAAFFAFPGGQSRLAPKG